VKILEVEEFETRFKTNKSYDVSKLQTRRYCYSQMDLVKEYLRRSSENYQGKMPEHLFQNVAPALIGMSFTKCHEVTHELLALARDKCRNDGMAFMSMPITEINVIESSSRQLSIEVRGWIFVAEINPDARIEFPNYQSNDFSSNGLLLPE
jgi:hypothetical protein